MADDKRDLAEETPSVVPADKIEGAAILNRQGVKIGTITDLMIEKRSGRVAYLVMSAGSVFGGLGEHLFPLPWGVLQEWNEDEGAYITDLDEDTLRRGPAVPPQERARVAELVADRGWWIEIHEHYRVPPAWR